MKKYLYIILGVILFAGVIWLVITPGKSGKYDAFAQCLKDKKAIFWGAFWCPHCQAQKARFGKSAKLLPYIECSTPDAQGQLQVCKDAGITTYPTWDFASSTAEAKDRVTGEMELTDLAERTSCELPK